MPLHSLSSELVQEIAGHLQTNEQAALRATCSPLCEAVSPIFFSTLTIDIQLDSFDEWLARLERVATGTTPYSKYVRTLHLANVTPELDSGPGCVYESGETQWSEKSIHAALKARLGPALQALRGVLVASWTTSYEDPDWVVDVVIAAFARWPLREVAYRTTRSGPVALPPLDRLFGAELIKLSILGPIIDMDLETLQNDLDLKPLVELLQRPPHLSSLGLALPPEVCLDDVWRVLSRTSVCLTDLRVAVVGISPTLCDYLGSYTGLRRLALLNVDESLWSRQAADLFVEQTLRQHSASLVELRVSPTYTGRWNFGLHNVEVFAALVHLETLEVAINPEDSRDDEAVRRDVALLLQLISRLPALRRVVLGCTLDERWREECGVEPKPGEHARAVWQRLREAVLSEVARQGGYRSDVVLELRGAYDSFERVVLDTSGWTYAHIFGHEEMDWDDIYENVRV